MKKKQTPSLPVEKGVSKSTAMSILFLGMAIGMLLTFGYIMTISESINNETLNNKTQAAFIYGMELTIAKITNESIQCHEIPMNYSGYEYTLFPLECIEQYNLDLNNNGGNK